MKDVSMDMNWRTVQFFLGDEGVSEVMVDADDSTKVKCTCPEFNKAAKCKHSRLVRSKMVSKNGHFKVQIPENIEDEIVIEAMKSPEGFRDFILKYGKVEIL